MEEEEGDKCSFIKSSLKMVICSFNYQIQAGPGCSGLSEKQMLGYSDGRTRSGGTVREEISGSTIPSILPEVGGYHTGGVIGESLYPSPFSTLIWRSWV